MGLTVGGGVLGNSAGGGGGGGDTTHAGAFAGSLVLGDGATDTGIQATTLGYQCIAHVQSIAGGRLSRATGSQAVAFGRGADALGTGSLAFGFGAKTNTSSGNGAWGTNAISNAQDAFQFGTGTNATANTFQISGMDLVVATGNIESPGDLTLDASTDVTGDVILDAGATSGTVRIPTLAGTGTRAIAVDPSGNIVIL